MPTRTTAKVKTGTPKAAKALLYRTVGRTSDGIAVLKPKAATSSPTSLGTKLARLMAEDRSTKARIAMPRAAATKKAKKSAQ